MSKSNKGFTLIELLTIIVCIGILIYISLPKFLDLSDQTEQSAEEEMVGHIKIGIDMYRAQAMVDTGNGNYPSTLDDADAGQSSPANPFFANVLQNPYRGGDWQKDAGGNYIGPAGGVYIYNSSTGTFTKQTE